MGVEGSEFEPDATDDQYERVRTKIPPWIPC